MDDVSLVVMRVIIVNIAKKRDGKSKKLLLLWIEFSTKNFAEQQLEEFVS